MALSALSKLVTGRRSTVAITYRWWIDKVAPGDGNPDEDNVGRLIHDGELHGRYERGDGVMEMEEDGGTWRRGPSYEQAVAGGCTLGPGLSISSRISASTCSHVGRPPVRVPIT